jgi:UDP-N-acetylmuramoyl-L-alanyl-D-glutamate--2,6-diaminopimelate ligase
MTMKREKALSSLLPEAKNRSEQIQGLSFDSRLVKSGDLFFAVPGFLENGTKYLPDAFAKGARAAVVEFGATIAEEFKDKVIEVKNVRAAMADAAGNFYNHPARQLKLYGVTGTKGKTSTSYLLESCFRAAGKRTAILGTVECRHPGKTTPSHHTTREAIDLQAFLAECVEEKVDVVVLEVSSHALSLDRVRGLEFDGMIFTNLSPDHMDFYKTMEPYYQAKRLLFLPPYRKAGAKAVAYADDEYGQRLLKDTSGNWRSFGSKQGDYQIQNSVVHPQGAYIELSTGHAILKLQSQIPGEFTFQNIAAAATLALEAGCKVAEVEKGIGQLVGVPGRLERVPTTLPFSVFVDFAHSGHALANVLGALRSVCRNRLIVVFGAGGDKDPARRTTQGKVSADLADYSVITSDNPRSEDPLKIIAAIETAHRAAGGKHFTVEPDRRKAIGIAIRMAKPGDVICLAGKGHETGQIIGNQVIPFDDREEAGVVLRELEKK